MKKDIHNKLIKYGAHTINDWVVIEIEGNKQKIYEFLQGQLTSDVNLINDDGFQMSSICDHKGYVVCDFIVNKNADIYKIIISKKLADILIKELEPFAQFFSVKFSLCKQKVVGHVMKSENNSNKSYWYGEKYCLGLEVLGEDFDTDDSIGENDWILANKLSKILFLDIKNIRKYRPLEINYDDLRVSFDKGCFRGQEILARMKYLGVDRRRFSTLVTKDAFKIEKTIKVVGEIIKVNDLKIFNAIIIKDQIDALREKDSVIKII